MPHFVYILLCSDDTLYTGYTTDVGRRVGEHNTGKGAKYTRTRRPVVLIYEEEHKSRNNALKREIQIKNMRRSSKLLLCTAVHLLNRG